MEALLTTSETDSLSQVSLTPHENLWFKDGSIILATDVHLYRVHKSILALHSSVFSDMFEIPTGDSVGKGEESASEDALAIWDGLPVVTMVGDSDESIYHLLMAMYNRDYYQPHKPTTIDIVLSLLQLSTKYDIPAIRQDVINQLEKHIPNDMEGWDALESMENMYIYDDCDFPPDGYFRLLNAATRCDVTSILPLLYYACANSGMQFIIEQSRLLSSDVLERLKRGFDRLSEYEHIFKEQAFSPHHSCRSDACLRARTQLLEVWTDLHSHEHVKVSLDRSTFEEGLEALGTEAIRAEVCEDCRKRSLVFMRELRIELWGQLPNLFGLGLWDELLKRDT